MKLVALVGLGSAMGGILRFLLAGWIQRQWGHALPVGTIIVNITGCLLMGFLAGLNRRGGDPGLSQNTRELLLTGVLGGYTTFSAFSLQTLTLVRGGQEWLALANVGLSVGLCLLAVAAGFWLGRAVSPA